MRKGSKLDALGHRAMEPKLRFARDQVRYQSAIYFKTEAGKNQKHLLALAGCGAWAQIATMTPEGPLMETPSETLYRTLCFSLDEESEDEHMSDVEDGFYRDMPEEHSSVPVVLPRDKFTGICNVQTVKDGMFPVSSK